MAFSNGTPTARSPSGIQVDSPLQRTWINFSSSGRTFRNAAAVSGAAASNRAVRVNGPAVITTSDMRAPVTVGGRGGPGSRRIICPSLKMVSPRRMVCRTRPRNDRPEIRADRVTLVQIPGSERELAVQIHQRQIGVHALDERALAGNPESAGGLGRQQRRHPLDWQPALVTAAVEQDGQRRLHAGDAAPRRDEVAALHRRRRRRMVGGDDVDVAARRARPTAPAARRSFAAAARTWRPPRAAPRPRR